MSCAVFHLTIQSNLKRFLFQYPGAKRNRYIKQNHTSILKHVYPRWSSVSKRSVEMRLSVLQSDSSFTSLSVSLVSNTQICEHIKNANDKGRETVCGVESANELRNKSASDRDHPFLSSLISNWKTNSYESWWPTMTNALAVYKLQNLVRCLST